MHEKTPAAVHHAGEQTEERLANSLEQRLVPAHLLAALDGDVAEDDLVGIRHAMHVLAATVLPVGKAVERDELGARGVEHLVVVETMVCIVDGIHVKRGRDGAHHGLHGGRHVPLW